MSLTPFLSLYQVPLIMPNCFATGRVESGVKLDLAGASLEPRFCIAGSFDCSLVTRIRTRQV